MKKKLAIFTAAVGFFTLCNVILYSRKLRADEMVSFWRWSITAAEANVIKNNNNNNNNYSTSYLADDQRESTNNTSATHGKEYLVNSVISVGQKQRVLSSMQGGDAVVGTETSRTTNYETNSTKVLDTTLTNAMVTENIATDHSKQSSSSSVSSTFHVDGNRSSRVTKPSTVSSTLTTTITTSTGSSSWSLIEAIMNRTYHYNANDSTACVEVSLKSPQRNLSVTFNISLIDELYGLDSFDDDDDDDDDHGGGSGVVVATTVSSLTTISNSDINSSWTGNWTTEMPRTTPQMSLLPLNSTYHASKRTHPPEGIVTKPSLVVKNGLSPLNEHPFSYLVNVEDLCKSNLTNLTLVILVTTAIGHVAHRQAIRETWGGLSKSLPDVRLAFLMGRPEHPSHEATVLREALQYADILQEDFMDTYKNLTLKSVMLLKWANKYCSNSRYVMKADDDMLINVPNLLKYLRSLRYNKGLLLGRLVRGARPLRTQSSKYYVPLSEYGDRIYPDYLSGTAYVMSSDVVLRLYSTSRTTPIFLFEDVFITGICAKKAKVVRRNHAGFVYYKRPIKGCAYFRAISGHDNTPSDLRKIWRELQRKNLKC